MSELDRMTMKDVAEREYRNAINATIDRCTQVVWDIEIEGGLAVGVRGKIAAAIKALKEER